MKKDFNLEIEIPKLINEQIKYKKRNNYFLLFIANLLIIFQVIFYLSQFSLLIFLLSFINYIILLYSIYYFSNNSISAKIDNLETILLEYRKQNEMFETLKQLETTIEETIQFQNNFPIDRLKEEINFIIYKYNEILKDNDYLRELTIKYSRAIIDNYENNLSIEDYIKKNIDNITAKELTEKFNISKSKAYDLINKVKKESGLEK